jgi:thioredoxin-related protein
MVDGYCKETNTIYEVYEKAHYRKEKYKKDFKRQKEIQNYLKCNFVIINDNYNNNEIKIYEYSTI